MSITFYTFIFTCADVEQNFQIQFGKRREDRNGRGGHIRSVGDQIRRSDQQNRRFNVQIVGHCRT